MVQKMSETQKPKKIWILRHYVSLKHAAGYKRLHALGTAFQAEGHDCRIFSASFMHHEKENLIKDDALWIEKDMDGIPLVLVRSRSYQKGTFQRILNMIGFTYHLSRVLKQFIKEEGTPNVIIASSPHPLVFLVGQELAKKYQIPCICEVRDLWPESFVSFLGMKPKSLLGKLLYAGEHFLYRRADQLVFTMAGGKDYIKDKGWTDIPEDKIHHINNGVDLASFEAHCQMHPFHDEDLSRDVFKVVYTGSVRFVNQLSQLIEIAKLMQDLDPKVLFLVYGEGDERQTLTDKARAEELTNLQFKGPIPMESVPSVLRQADLNFFILPPKSLYQYGISLNKLFDYFAAGRPILQTSRPGHCLVHAYQCGESLEDASSLSVVKAILRLKALQAKDPAAYEAMGQNALLAAQDYDFKKLAKAYDKLLSKALLVKPPVT